MLFLSPAVPLCFHVDRLYVSPETDIVTSRIVESDLAYPRVSSGQCLSPRSNDPFLPVIQQMTSWFALAYNSGGGQRLFDRFTSIGLSAWATHGSPDVSPGGCESISLDFVCPPVGFPVMRSSRTVVMWWGGQISANKTM